jgi:hypothetical protein
MKRKINVIAATIVIALAIGISAYAHDPAGGSRRGYSTDEQIYGMMGGRGTMGDFDGNSAYELINVLNEAGSRFWEIFIDTNGLKTIHQFGRVVFEKNFSVLNKKLSNLIFIGENGNKISTS